MQYEKFQRTRGTSKFTWSYIYKNHVTFLTGSVWRLVVFFWSLVTVTEKVLFVSSVTAHPHVWL